jgi:hypothetical protein
MKTQMCRYDLNRSGSSRRVAAREPAGCLGADVMVSSAATVVPARNLRKSATSSRFVRFCPTISLASERDAPTRVRTVVTPLAEPTQDARHLFWREVWATRDRRGQPGLGTPRLRRLAQAPERWRKSRASPPAAEPRARPLLLRSIPRSHCTPHRSVKSTHLCSHPCR